MTYKANFFSNKALKALVILFGFTLLYCICFQLVFPVDKLIAPGDGWREFAPQFYTKKAIWTNLVCSGYPTIADPQFQFWYPLTIFFQCFHSYNGLVISANVLASCWAYLFTYTITKSKLAATISGISYGMSGFLLAHVEHPSMTHAAIWIPLMLTAVNKLSSRINHPWLIVGALAIFMTLLGGHSQISTYALGLVAIYSSYLLFHAKQKHLQYVFAILGMFILGFGLSAIQTIPTIEWIHQSTREINPYSKFISHPIIPIEFWELIYPNLCCTFCHEISCYVGILPLLLLGTAILARRYDPDFLFWLSIMLISICLMQGGANPLAKIMYYVPIYNLYRCVARHSLEFTVAFSILAGISAQKIQLISRDKSVFKQGIVICTLLALLVIFGTYWSQDGFFEYTHHYAQYEGIGNLSLNPLENIAIRIPILIIIITTISFLIWLAYNKRTWCKVLLISTFVLDMGLSGFYFHTEHTAHFLPDKSMAKNPPAIAIAAKNLIERNGGRLLPIPTYEKMYASVVENGMPPNIPLFWNIPIASGYPARFKRYKELTNITECGFAHSLFNRNGCELDLAGVKYVIHPDPDVGIRDVYPDLNTGSRFKKIVTSGSFSIYENLHAMPHAWLVSKTVCLTSNEVLQTIHTCKFSDKILNNSSGEQFFNPAQTALIEDASVPIIDSHSIDGVVQIVKVKNTLEEFITNCSKPSMLVVSGLYYPGWEATINGKSAKIYITNYALRGIVLKPGLHRVIFEYKPQSLYLGIAISSFSLLVLLLILLSTKQFNKQKYSL